MKLQEAIKEIDVIENNGVFMVPADFEENFVLIPVPEGNMNLVFWDENCLNLFLENYGFVPIITHKN
ncbi:MAG: hypothetical protein AB1610_07015 [Nitrospirota bacterium]